MQEKLAITVILITLALFALVFIIYRIIDENGDTYNQIVLSQQEYDSRVIPYRRGDIVDRNGTYLATTEKVYNLILDPKQIMSDQENYLEVTISALTEVFGFDAADLRVQITSNPDKAYVRYARQLSFDQKESFETLTKTTNTANMKNDSKARIKGVWFEDEYRRIYPNNSLACNVIGFATGDGAGGNGGIEQYYNDKLIGTNGREYGYLNDDSNLERVIKSAVNGDTIVSTIDVNIQNVVEKYIKEWQADPGADRVGVVVMNPKNGEVLAMSSDKMFDLNNPRTAADKYSEEEIRALGVKEAVNAYKLQHRDTDGSTITADQVTQHFSEEEIRSFGLQVAWNQEWRNFCISDTYEPGSPSKIFTVSTALEEGVISGNESFMCDGGQEVGGWFIKCVNKYGHGILTVPESLMQSCNDVMMQISAMIGRSRFSHYMQMFGFGSKTGIDLPGEADTKNLVYNEENMKPSDLATNSFGQNYNCTMIQMAAAYCSVINGGSYYEPHVVKQILNEQGAVVKKIEPNLVRETVSESTANFIKDALFRTVSEGTGKAAAVEGYEIAGKTGTAEKYPRGHGNYLVSFCGFAPAYDPQVLVYVIIDTPHVADQPHSTYASGVFSKIMAEILPYMNIFPAYTGEEDSAAMEALPQQEGIADNSANAENGEPVPEETKVYATEEYVDPEVEENSGIPNNVPVDENGGMIVEIDPGSGDDSSYGSGVSDSQVVVNAEDNWAAEASKAADREEESQNGEEEMQEIVIQ
jgi:stage V sporulation protein D (sporulation-specific penicillin-binding protein)